MNHKKTYLPFFGLFFVLTMPDCGGSQKPPPKPYIATEMQALVQGDATAIAAGSAHTAALRSDGTVIATNVTDRDFDYGQSDVAD